MNRIKWIPIIYLITLFVLVSSILYAQSKSPLTTAETSNYTATSTYNEVMSFIDDILAQSPYIRKEKLCTSTEGREIPLLVLGNPVPSSPMELTYDNRAVLYIQGNIHAGEVEGKEAILMLMRDILQSNNPEFLDQLVILLAPIFNADGNEKFSENNRRSQNGPKSVGIRYNGQNLDLNRDAMKMESPEVQGLVKNVLNKWDPFLLVDCHTTNGSYHIEPVTYVWGFNPNGAKSIIDYMRLTMIPFIQKNMKDQYNILSIPYGNFMDRRNLEKGWRPAGPEVRYITNYIGLRNRLAILNENYSYADFKTRVLGCYAFLRSVLEHCYANKDQIVRLVMDADNKQIAKGMNPTAKDSFAVEYNLEPYDEKITIIAYEMEEIASESGRRPRYRRTDKQRKLQVPYYCKYVPKRSVRFPYAYLIPKAIPEVIHKLEQHGILVEKLTKPVTLEVESFLVSELNSADRLYQGHRLNSVSGSYTSQNVEFPAGTYFIPTGQKLGNIAAYLLEPEANDGLLVWNYFDRYLVPQWRRAPQTYPVYKLYNPTNLVKTKTE